MARRSSLVYLVAVLFSAGARASGWESWQQVCRDMNEAEGTNWDCSQGPLVTERSSLPYWAGEVVQVYVDVDKREFTRFMVKITWVADRSSYECGAVVKLSPTEVKDFTHRSLAMKRCN